MKLNKLIFYLLPIMLFHNCDTNIQKHPLKIDNYFYESDTVLFWGNGNVKFKAFNYKTDTIDLYNEKEDWIESNILISADEIHFYETGSKATEFHYVEGEKQGVFKYYDCQKQLKKEEHWDNGKLKKTVVY